MNKKYLKSLIDGVSAIEVQNETQQIAKYELIEYVEELQDKIDKAIEIAKANHGSCMWCESVEEILKGDNNEC